MSNFDCPHCGQDLKLGVDAPQRLKVLESRNAKLEEALRRINKTGLDRSLGQIVGSEHYEKAWLDCVELAGRSLATLDEKGRE